MHGLPALELLLRSNAYPGRGIVVARTGDGTVSACYFLTGRSEASLSRRLERAVDGDIQVASTVGGRPDPLRHYTAVAKRGRWFCVGNGGQVSEIASALDAGTDPLTAFATHDYEPDDPIFTSRITVAVADGEHPAVLLGTSRRPLRDTDRSDTTLLSLGDLGAPGSGVLSTTYQSDGDHIGPAQPYREVQVSAQDHRGLLDAVWSSLNPAYRVAALALTTSHPDDVELRHDGEG